MKSRTRSLRVPSRGLGAVFTALFVFAQAGCGPKPEPRFSPPPPPAHTLRADPAAGSAGKRGPGTGARAGDGALDVAPGNRHPDTVLQQGKASYYGDAFSGRKTASGEKFDPSLMTAAHPSLPFGTWVSVRRKDTGRMVNVRINDRGPFRGGRIIDLSRGAAQALDMLQNGVVDVELRMARGPE